MTYGGRFIINLDRVMICGDEVQSAILCVQDFVRSPHVTQRNFFLDSVIAMLAESAAISDRITLSAVFEPWGHVETTSRSQVVVDVCGCLNEALDRRRLVKTHKRNGMRWVASGYHRKIRHPDPVSRFQISWKRGESSTFLYVSPFLFLWEVKKEDD